MAALTLLSTHELCRTFGGLEAVDRVDFEVKEGDIHALIGPNGAGKTTFVNLISGRTKASRGKIVYRGEDITLVPAYQRVRRGIAYTFQITSIYPNLTAYENVAIAAQGNVQGKPNSLGEISLQTNNALSRAGLAERTHIKAGELAYGHQRLLEIAMGLALNPTLLILDEPTQGLADVEIEEFCALVQEINNDATVLIIEHNMAVVMHLAQTITVLNQGRVLAQGAPDAIRENPEVQAAYLGT